MEGLSVFARRLNEARTKADISQRNLGIAAGIDEFSSSARINQYERGKHYPDYETAERLAQVLGVPTPYFFTRDDELAKLILLLADLSPRQINELVAYVSKISKDE